MANFYTSLPAEEIARQVAELLNNHNKLRKRHTAQSIMSGRGAYSVDIVGGQVIACSAIIRENEQITRQFHLCVHPDWRRRGLGRKLKLAALGNVSTPYVYVTIREDNVASINLNTSVGFVFVKKDWVGDHYVLTLGRMMTGGQRPSTVVTKEHAQTEPVSSAKLFYTGYND